MLLLAQNTAAVTWATLYTYGSLTDCSTSSLLSVTANAMGVCYQLTSSPPTSFLMNCTQQAAPAMVKMTCQNFNSADCSGDPVQGLFSCPYNFDFPSTCAGGVQAKCESGTPETLPWLNYPGYVVYSNESSSVGSDQCSLQAPVTLYGLNPACAEISFGGLLQFSQQAVVVSDSLVVNTYSRPQCSGNYTSQTVITGLDSCHQMSVATPSAGPTTAPSGFLPPMPTSVPSADPTALPPAPSATPTSSVTARRRVLHVASPMRALTIYTLSATSSETVYGASSLSAIPSVESALGETSPGASSSEAYALTSGEIVGIVVCTLAFVFVATFAIHRRYFHVREKDAGMDMGAALLDNDASPTLNPTLNPYKP